ncbi:MAG: low specificity L-threonine aldolase [Terrimicrobiaceae bacterium]
MQLRYDFASDNTAGLCPEALGALVQASKGCCPSYGEDAYTARATDMIREIFETDCDVYFVFNGTAANSLALAAMCNSYHSVVCHEASHIETDECGAPEFFSNGTKILLTSGPEGKLDCPGIERMILKRSDIHYPKPRVVSLTQPTELGCLYSAEEIREIATLAQSHGLRVHMDGTRFANAVAALEISPADLTWRAGVDVLCFGGIKPGISLSEAVVFFDRRLSEEFDYRCKQGGQLAAKMRFSSAPWAACLQSGVWLRNAANANRTALLLAEGLKAIAGIEIARPVAVNAVFADLSLTVRERLRGAGWRYYEFIGGAARLMTSWRTSDEDVHSFLASARGD